MSPLQLVFTVYILIGVGHLVYDMLDREGREGMFEGVDLIKWEAPWISRDIASLLLLVFTVIAWPISWLGPHGEK